MIRYDLDLDTYLDMVQELLDYQRSLMTGDLDLHLRAMAHMPMTILIMLGILHTIGALTTLGDTHPGLCQAYLYQHLSAKRTIGCFNRLFSDQVIEQTINNKQKGKYGIIGSSTSEGTVKRWILTIRIVAGLMT